MENSVVFWFFIWFKVIKKSYWITVIFLLSVQNKIYQAHGSGENVNKLPAHSVIYRIYDV